MIALEALKKVEDDLNAKLKRLQRIFLTSSRSNDQWAKGLEEGLTDSIQVVREQILLIEEAQDRPVL